ncbi:DUF6118 family protein [Sphingomonas glacialis]|uniref:Uncharacterized protein n=1 Tax=Sphingomonas glacialis TaxID=658225 RepID=A0A502FS16_9SPHN|nr:DUF6118 family protein [Sphingomonas glacialis]TPG52211.1 hypothetical protein EAH76_16070 [Sphingomonas glacialis]
MADEAAQAFEDLRGEVSLIRRAAERLTAQRAEPSDAPDYSETLGVISQNVLAAAQRIDAVVNSPALLLTPEELNHQIIEAAYNAPREDHRLFLAAQHGFETVARQLTLQLHSHTEADEQRRRLRHVGMAALAAGILLWAILPGPIVRALPASWLWPEWMAAHTLRMPMWQSGQRLMRAASPTAFAGILSGNRLIIANRDTLDACRKKAARAKKAVRCEIQVMAEE